MNTDKPIDWTSFSAQLPPDGALCFVSDGTNVAVAVFSPVRTKGGAVFEGWSVPDADGEYLTPALGDFETCGRVTHWQEIKRPAPP